MKKLLMAVVFAMVSHPAYGDDYSIFGTWVTQDQSAKITIMPCGNGACGHMTWIDNPYTPDGSLKRDNKNPDSDLRSRPLLGLRILWGFEKKSPDLWTGGKIYSALKGRSYDARLELMERDRLKVSGCVLMFCGGEIWTRFDYRP